MTAAAFTCTNAAGLKLCGWWWARANATTTWVLQHGAAGRATDPAVEVLKEALLARPGQQVITFDASCNLGDSAGDLHDLRLSTHAADLTAIITWAQRQPQWRGALALGGHSLGAASALLYAAAHPAMVQQVVAISPVVGGPAWWQTYQHNYPAVLAAWQAAGQLVKTTPDHPRHPQALSWGYVAEILTYDLIHTTAPQVRCPVTLVVGDDDRLTPPAVVNALADALHQQANVPVTLHVVPGGSHLWTRESEQRALGGVLLLTRV